MKTLYLDLVGGAAGDMILASLLDLGARVEPIRAAYAALGLDRVELRTETVHPAGLRALRVDMMIGGTLADSGPPSDHEVHGHRPYRTIKELLERSAISASVRAIAQATFRRLAEAEAKAHGTAADDVEFHEVGADDAIADVVGVAVAILDLGIERIVVSPVPLGRGLGRGHHGHFPLPGPATLNILEGAAIVGTELEGETVTPTGAALIMALADEFGSIPAFRLIGTGVGAGHRSWPDRANIVRALLGEAADPGLERSESECVVEANLDDMSPEHLPPLIDALFAAGALDAWWTGAQMKKGRAGAIVSALARRTIAPAVAQALMLNSTTLGVRIHEVDRLVAEREIETIETEFGAVRVKRARRPVGPPLIKPEHDDCARLALQHGLPIRVVFEAALRAAWSR